MLMVLGASHHDLELTHLERLTTGGDLLERAVLQLVHSAPDAGAADSVGSAESAGGVHAAGIAEDAPVVGAVVVATCNRLEIYLETRRFHDAIDAVASAVAQAAGIEADEATSLLKVRVGAPVAAHLFSVVSGLDSMVVGEAEIAGQVGRAFRTAQLAGTTTPMLNALFQSAARTAKQVSSTTSLGAAGRSIASVALDVAEERFRTPATALVVGTGAYARVVAAELRARGCQDLQVFSPSGRADTFAARHHADPVAQDALVDVLAKVDMVVTCSGGSGDALSAETLQEALARRDTPLPIVDLALRPDVSEPARAVPGVQVIDLRTVSERVDPVHAGQLTAAQDIVIAGVAAFEEQQVVRRLDPAVIALRRHVTAAVDKELARLRGKYDDAVAADVELAMHRVTQSLLHTPTLRARELARTGEGAGYVQALHTLFGIEVPVTQDSPAH